MGSSTALTQVEVRSEAGLAALSGWWADMGLPSWR